MHSLNIQPGFCEKEIQDIMTVQVLLKKHYITIDIYRSLSVIVDTNGERVSRMRWRMLPQSQCVEMTLPFLKPHSLDSFNRSGHAKFYIRNSGIIFIMLSMFGRQSSCNHNCFPNHCQCLGFNAWSSLALASKTWRREIIAEGRWPFTITLQHVTVTRTETTKT